MTSPLPLDRSLSFEDAVLAISSDNEPGSIVSGKARNVLVEAWGQLVGRERAISEFEFFVSDAGSLTAAARRLRATTATMRRWRAAFEALPPDAEPKRDLQGAVVGGWHLVRRLGSGGNGEVWVGRRGRDTAAVKVLKRSRGIGLARFRDEIRAQRELSGTPGILPLVDSFLDSDPHAERPWLATPVATPLRMIFGPETTLAEVVECIAAIASALAEAHARGFSHRDVKPDNMFKRNGAWEIGDFGLVDFPDKRDLTQDVAKLGPVYFIAPEMLNNPGEADGKHADSFSLAKSLWVLATGQTYPAPGRLDPGVNAMKLTSYISDSGADALHPLLDRATDHDPAGRPSMSAFRDELATWLRARSDQARPESE